MKKVLLIEDDPYLIGVYLTKLESEGFFVEAAKDEENAFKIIQKDKFDLILFDIMFSKINEEDLLRCIKKSKKNQHCKIIVLTDSDNFESIKSKVDKCFTKIDYTPDEILEEIKQLIG